MRVLLLGAGGMLARDLRATAPPQADLLALTRRDLDVADEVSLAGVLHRERPAVVLNAAGYTRVDDAERDQATAFAVNARAPGSIGRAAAAIGAVVVHFSSDYIFDGDRRVPYREDDAPHPLSVYGASKVEGERALQASGAEHLIIRTQWLFGLHGRSFPRTMWERAHRRAPTRVVADQTGRPTCTEDLARATWTLIGLGARGVLHVANSGMATWYDVAREVFQAAGAAELVSPCTTAEYPSPARRPAWSVLDTGRYEAFSRWPLPPWTQAMERFLRRLAEEP
ncbi:MAG TPA: dTDP-4-dehydrorhamnose reductase [Gemmatimonadales bacterium]|nr:dTDP-4-dehydrorhamnose reductase [Gemmatimonadales bacterium]